MHLQDFRFALRQLRKAPGFTLTAVLTLALGIGALTTVATWTNAVLYNPWPHVSAPRQIHFIDASVLGGEGYSVHYDVYRYLHDSGRSWSNSIAFDVAFVNLADPGTQPRSMPAGTVSSNYFQFLSLTPQAGRFFNPSDSDHAFGAHDEVVLSDALWRDRFQASPSLIGRTISINKHPFTVIGVAPRDFAGIYGGLAESAWLPLSSLRELSTDAPPDPLQHDGLQVAVRLRPGVSERSAAAEVHTLARSFAAQNPGHDHWDLNLRDAAHMEKGFFGIVGEELPILAGASVLLMILVCINIASLLGQHAARRRREVAIRTALGAHPSRIAAQVLAETGLLAAAGALAGWAASTAISRALYLLLPTFGYPIAFNLHSDPRILLFVIAIAAAVTLLCGLYPVRQSLRFAQNEALHQGGASVTGRSHRNYGGRLLLGLQLGICFIVLTGCGLLTRTAFNILSRPIGFNPARVLTATIDFSRAGYDARHTRQFEATLLDRLRATPGITAATLTTHLPMGDMGTGNAQGLTVPGYVPAKGEDMEVVTDFEGSDFFHTMVIPILQGRGFSTADNASAPDVALVNQPMASRYWPKGNAIGSMVIVNKRPRRIIGIIGDYMYADPTNTGADPLLFLPLAQNDYSYAIIALRYRTTADAAAAALRSAVSAQDRLLPLEDVSSLESVIGMRYQMSRIPAELLSVYAFSSVLVALIGLYAVMAFSVLERYREFALRMALGSTRSGVFRLVLRGSASTALIGLVTGAAGSLATVRILRALLYGVTPFDPLSYSAAALFLLLTVFVAGLLPARRAANIEPMQALRSE
ncbi:MAG TPA: ADOP family duplicated permease [Acidobacteriaceae bacterium]|jgi:predicted permease|nr:ADOP family duplicated permease [Acidobacteriaceae bacterium]